MHFRISLQKKRFIAKSGNPSHHHSTEGGGERTEKSTGAWLQRGEATSLRAKRGVEAPHRLINSLTKPLFVPLPDKTV